MMSILKTVILCLAFIFACFLPSSALTPTAPENRIWEISSTGYDAATAEAADLSNRTETSTSDYDLAPIYSADGKHRSALGTRVLFGSNAEFKAAGEEDAELHHIMTNKNNVSQAAGGPYTPKFEEMAEKATIDLDDDINKMLLPGHQGPHPDYNAQVYNRLLGPVNTN